MVAWKERDKLVQCMLVVNGQHAVQYQREGEEKKEKGRRKGEKETRK